MTASLPAERVSSVAPHASFASARLLADVGGTNARFALELAPGSLEAVRVLACGDHASFADAMRAYLALPEVAAFGKAW
jgi:glucokinase